MREECWFADLGQCDGQLQRAHWIPKQRMKQRGIRSQDVIWDERCWSFMCERCHHRFDKGFLSVKREELPFAIEGFAVDHGLEFSLDRDFGPLVVRCRAQVSPKCYQLSGSTTDEVYLGDHMSSDRTFDRKTMTVCCDACYVEIGNPAFADLDELEEAIRRCQ
jgi:hypothetical protein